MTGRTRFGTPRAVRAGVVLAAVVTAFVALAGCAAGPHHRSGSHDTHPNVAALASTRAPVTARHTFDPYSASGTLSVAVAHRAGGSCWSTSLADPTASAYRCFAGHQILDPCFARAGAAKGSTVACVADPWSSATVLTLTRALPSRTFAVHRVFAFVRSDGAKCVAATGTVPAVAGRNLDYNCTDHTVAALGSIKAQHVHAVFAKAGATSLRSSGVRELWHS